MAFAIKKGYQDPQRAEKEKAYQYLASLGIAAPKTSPPENLFYMGVPADADVYDAYAAAIAKRTVAFRGRALALKDPKAIEDRNFLAILAVNAIAFSFNHKLPVDTETALSEYLAELWGTSRFALLLKKINDLPPEYRGDLVVLSDISAFDRQEFREREYKAAMKHSKATGLEDVLRESVEMANTAKHLYKFLFGKADWEREQIERETHYDREMTSDDGGATSLRDMLPGLEADDLYNAIDEKIDIAALHAFIERLPSGMKIAVRKFLDGEEMILAEQKAKNRAIQKIRKWAEAYSS
jgi:hypothetical protein